MLDRLIDSSQKNDPGECARVRLSAEISERRLWIAGDGLSGRAAQALVRGSASASAALIAAPARRLSVWVAGVIGRS